MTIGGVSDTFTSTTVAPAAPTGDARIFYTDLTSVPINGWATVYGKGFGSTQGSSTIECGGTGCTPVTWADDKIEFQVPSSASTSGIVVTTSLGSSNTFPFTVRTSGTLRFCSPSGNDSTGAGTLASPWRNPNLKWDSMQSGDVMYLRGGTYTAQQDTYSGGTWFFWRTDAHSGVHHGGSSASLPMAMVAYPGETADCGSDSFGCVWIPYGVIQNVTFAKMTWRTGSAGPSQNEEGLSSNVRFVAIESAGPQDSTYNYFGLVGTNGLKILGCRIMNNGLTGEKLSHSIYYEGYGSSTDVEIAWNYILNQRGGRGIQVYAHTATDSLTNLYIHDNYVDTTTCTGILVGVGDGGAPANWVTNAYIYNNLVRRSGNPNGYTSNAFLPEQSGMHIAATGTNFRIAHNTLANDQVYNCIWIDRTGTTTGGLADFKNNLFIADKIVLDNMSAANTSASYNGRASSAGFYAYNSGTPLSTPSWWTNEVSSASAPTFNGGSGTTVQTSGYLLASGVFKSAGTTWTPPAGALGADIWVGGATPDMGIVSY